jgi:phosphoserine phosphatase RsbU/P
MFCFMGREMMESAFPMDLQVLSQVLDHMNLGVYITDTERRILLWNNKAEEITGHKAADVVGRPCSDGVLCHIDSNGVCLCSSELCPLYRSIKLDKASVDVALVYAQNSDGGRVPVSVSTAPLSDDQGNVFGGIETFREETSRIRDLEFAKTIQRSLLPETLPEIPGVHLDVLYNPRDLVGGDFYDVREEKEGVYSFMLADVRGHGVSASLYTMWLKSFEDSLGALRRYPQTFMSRLNEEMSKHVIDESFATGIYGVLDMNKGRFAYCNAGHPAPLHWHAATDEISELASHGMPLGVMEDEEYESSSVDLAPGDMLLLYTDGATEVHNREGKMLMPAGLMAMVASEMGNGTDDQLSRIYERVVDYCGDVTLDDDISLLSLQIEGES